jgi:HEXXH motif-containing protein
VSTFCSRFLKVIVLQQDDKGQSVSAYSTQQYPGRAVISNPQFIDVVQTAESVVHEAIHAYLYMLSQTYPWGISDPGYDDKPKVLSPWTGTLLPVSTFLHACFVWYGLLNFWSHALLADTFPSRRVRGRMSRAARGFLGKSLLDMMDKSDLALVFEPIRRAIDRMQFQVQNSSIQAPSSHLSVSAG